MLMTAAKIALGPVLLLQGHAVRRNALRLPEPAGERAGVVGNGARELRLLIVGDSAIAGVGAAHQRDALAGQLAGRLALRLEPQGLRLRWTLVARTGATTADAVELIDEAWAATGEALRADVAVVGAGVNDVTGQVPVARWLRTMDALAQRLSQRHGAGLIVLSGLPPMHLFPALPQPLRWYLGEQARRHDRALQRWASGRLGMLHVPLPTMTDPSAMASDGFHPGPPVYRAWAEALAEQVSSNLPRVE